MKIMKMVNDVESSSTASLCMKGVMDDAWRRIKERRIEKLLEDDEEMVIFTSDLILSWRIREIKVREDNNKEERMLRQAMLTMEWKARREMIFVIVLKA
jgi:hypothetical protein